VQKMPGMIQSKYTKTGMKSASLAPIVPLNDETRAMLDYASSPDGRAKIEKGRQEIRDGKGIIVTAGYFEDLNQRISERTTRTRGS
jgi:tRNA G37 N-methylase TrmD